MLNKSLRDELIAMGLPQMMHERGTLSKILEIRTGTAPGDAASAEQLARALITFERTYVEELVSAARSIHTA